MFLRILKNELKHKKGINIILFLFICLATIFVASSINNVLIILDATEYCLDKGEVPDDCFWIDNDKTKEQLNDWLDTDGKQYYDRYEVENSICIVQSNIKSFADKKGCDYDIINSITVQACGGAFMKIFDQDGKEVTISKGQIAMQQEELERNNLHEGDSFVLKIGEIEKEFTVCEAIQDPAFGGDYIGQTRYMVSKEDFEELEKEATTILSYYCINTKDVTEFSNQVNHLSLQILVECNRDLFAMSYIVPLIAAGILIIVGICLIIIAFLILKFTISITIQEDYREIGILKAIGMGNFSIKKIYLVRYIALAILSAVLGCIVSVPTSDLLLHQITQGMMLKEGATYVYVNILSAVGIVIVVILFSYLSTRRLKKVSAIDAIRNGNCGERFQKTSMFSLHKNRRIHLLTFLGINDILARKRRYIVMVLTFAIGTIMINLCANTITTFGSDEMAKNFLLDSNSEAFISADTVLDANFGSCSQENVNRVLDDLRETFALEGYVVKPFAEVFYSVSIYSKQDEKDVRNFLSIQPIGSDGSYIQLVDGTIPKLENEVVVSEMIMDSMGLSIGDTIHVVIDEVDYKMIIVGTYQNYMQMGQTVLLSSSFETKDIPLRGAWYFQLDFDNTKVDDTFIQQWNEDHSKYQLQSQYDVMQSQLGSTISQIDMMRYIIIILVCGLSFLITILMMKIFIIGEQGEIAMLRSIGFSIRAVRCRQVIRMMIVLLIGVIVGVIASPPLSFVGIRPIFAMMGATHIQIQVNWIETIIIYPVILLVFVGLAAYWSSSSIKKMNLMDINNME